MDQQCSLCQVDIRECVPESNENDMELMVKGYLSIWNEIENLKFLSYSGQLFEEKQVRSWFSSHLKRGVRYFCVFPVNESRIIGIMIINQVLHYGIDLGGIGILPEFQGNGIGKLLITECINNAKQNGFKAIDTEVFANNYKMLRLLLGFEFQPVRMEFNKGCDGTDLVHLKKYIKNKER